MRTWRQKLCSCCHKEGPGLRVSLNQIFQGVVVPEIPGVALLSASRALCLARALLELQITTYAAGADCVGAKCLNLLNKLQTDCIDLDSRSV